MRIQALHENKRATLLLLLLLLMQGLLQLRLLFCCQSERRSCRLAKLEGLQRHGIAGFVDGAAAMQPYLGLYHVLMQVLFVGTPPLHYLPA